MARIEENDEFLGLNALSNMYLNISEGYDNYEGDFTREEILKSALELTPQSADVMECLAIYYEINGDDPLKEEEFYLKAIENDPNNKRILYNFGNF